MMSVRKRLTLLKALEIMWKNFTISVGPVIILQDVLRVC